MAVTDDVADDNVQSQPPLSPQCFSQTFAVGF